MKQKLFLGALLFGTLALGGCVDDTESQSVQDVRKAKAEQLKSLAALNDANAQAALITANATKAAQEAEAEYKKALAAVQEAQAALIAAQTESAKAAAMQALANAERAKAQAAADLQTIAAQLEIDLLNKKKDLLIAQQQYEEALKNNDVKKQQELEILFSDYKEAQEALLHAQYLLAQDEILLAKAKAGIITKKEAVEEEIKGLNNEIADLLSDIAENQAYIDTWKEYVEMTPEQAEAAKLKANQEWIALNKKYQAAQAEVTSAAEALTAAEFTMQNSDYANAVSEIRNFRANSPEYGQTESSVRVEYVYESSTDAPKEARGFYCAVITEYGETNWSNGNFNVVERTYVPLFSNVDRDQEGLKYTIDGQESVVNYNVVNAYYDYVAGSFAKAMPAVEKVLARNEKQLADYTKYYEEAVKNQAEAQKAYDAAVKADTDLKAAQEAYNDAVTAESDAIEAQRKAQAAVDQAGAEATDAQKKALDDAKAASKTATEAREAAYDKLEEANDAAQEAGNVNDKLKDLNTCKASALSWLEAKNYAENEVDADKEFLAEVKANSKAIEDGVDSNKANIKAYNDASLAKAKTEVAEKEAENAASVKKAEYDAIAATVLEGAGGNINVGQEVAAKENLIKEWNTKIEGKKAEIAAKEKELASDKWDYEPVEGTTIKDLENKIATRKAYVETLQAKFDAAKAALDKAMEAPTTPEAPETPAE